MNNVQLVVFDMAGTTVRDKGNVGIAFMDAFRKFGIEVPLEEVKKVMGFKKKDAIRTLLNKFDNGPSDNRDEQIEKIHDAFIRNMVSFYENDPEISALPHVEETFQWLKQRGVKIALNTGFTREIADTILKRLHWNENSHIDYVIASDEVPQGRPYPYMIQAIMHELQVTDSASVVKVGDTEVDVEEGRNAGCGLVVSVTTGAYSRGQLEECEPDTIIDSLEELPSLIQ